MIAYVYDGTFEGLLTASIQAMREQVEPDQIIPEKLFEPDLFVEPKYVETKLETTAELITELRGRISHYGLQNLYYAYLSEEPGIESLVYNYLKLVFQKRTIVESNFNEPTVLEIRKISDKVSKEAHRFKGLVRFRRLKDNTYYAAISPDFNILSLLGPHFAARFADQRWAIHDVARQMAIIYDLNQWQLVRMTEEVPELTSLEYEQGKEYYTQEELSFQEYWNVYHHNIAIAERANPRLQRQLLPRRYWGYLIEEMGG